jgi:hypothetical protein
VREGVDRSEQKTYDLNIEIGLRKKNKRTRKKIKITSGIARPPREELFVLRYQTRKKSRPGPNRDFFLLFIFIRSSEKLHVRNVFQKFSQIPSLLYAFDARKSLLLWKRIADLGAKLMQSFFQGLRQEQRRLDIVERTAPRDDQLGGAAVGGGGRRYDQRGRLGWRWSS